MKLKLGSKKKNAKINYRSLGWNNRRYRPSIFGASPDFDWIFLVVVFLVVMGGAIYFGFHNHTEIIEMIDQEPEVPFVKREKVTLDQVDALLQHIEQKNENFRGVSN